MYTARNPDSVFRQRCCQSSLEVMTRFLICVPWRVPFVSEASSGWLFFLTFYDSFAGLVDTLQIPQPTAQDKRVGIVPAFSVVISSHMPIATFGLGVSLTEGLVRVCVILHYLFMRIACPPILIRDQALARSRSKDSCRCHDAITIPACSTSMCVFLRSGHSCLPLWISSLYNCHLLCRALL